MKHNGSNDVRRLGQRLVCVGSIVLYSLLGGAIVWLAATRWNGVPADPGGAVYSGTFGPSVPIDPALDRTEALTAALAAVPAPPALVLPPPPPTKRWTGVTSGPLHVADILLGEWTPQTRPHLQGVVAFLETPGVEGALSEIASIEPGGWRPFDPNGPGLGVLRSVRDATKLFVARARYHHAGRGDVEAAFADLASTCRMSATVFDSGTLIGPLTAIACDELANAELRHLAHEHDLTAEQATLVCSAMPSQAVDVPRAWRGMMAGEFGELGRIVDLCWTDDGYGDGWLVLSYLGQMAPAAWASKPRCGAWNLLSPLFNDRQTVLCKIARLEEIYEEATRLPYQEAVAHLKSIETSSVFNVTDGPLSLAFIGRHSRTYELAVRQAASRSATATTVALSAYHHEHGAYPVSLDGLLDAYLETLPLDPYVDEPLRYRREGDGFMLYSVGPNQVDDGGRKHSSDPATGRIQRDGDWIYSNPRPESRLEPQLEDIQP